LGYFLTSWTSVIFSRRSLFLAVSCFYMVCVTMYSIR